jgi:hypothetical protein
MLGLLFFAVFQIPAVFIWLWILGRGEFGETGSLDAGLTALAIEAVCAVIAFVLSGLERH